MSSDFAYPVAAFILTKWRICYILLVIVYSRDEVEMRGLNQRADHELAFMLRYENVAWYEDGEVRILDRRVYPREVRFVVCKSHVEVTQAIADMVTQSAGPYTAAGMGMALAAYECRGSREASQKEFLARAAEKLAHARLTTANRMKLVVSGCLAAAEMAMQSGQAVSEAIFRHTIAALQRRYTVMSLVAEHLADHFPKKGKIMTQCFGETIVGTMLREARKRNQEICLFCPETRPYLQGARLTASVAKDMGFEVTVITDNMAAFVMQQKGIDLFTSAADSICLDGHIVNKVGTLQLAISANFFGIPYFVTGIPDRDKEEVAKVKIEERDQKEVLMMGGVCHTMEGVRGYYPSFDITPPHLISGVVTDKGMYSPYDLARYFDSPCQAYY